MRIRIDRGKRGGGRFQLCLKLILRDLLPGNRSIVSQIVGGPLCQRSLVGAARLSVSNGAIRDAPILRHTPMLKSPLRRSSSSDANTLFRFCISAAPAALDRYLAAVPAMSLIPFAPFRCQRLYLGSSRCARPLSTPPTA